MLITICLLEVHFITSCFWNMILFLLFIRIHNTISIFQSLQYIFKNILNTIRFFPSIEYRVLKILNADKQYNKLDPSNNQ